MMYKVVSKGLYGGVHVQDTWGRVCYTPSESTRRLLRSCLWWRRQKGRDQVAHETQAFWSTAYKEQS